jgi:hypothetical protein
VKVGVRESCLQRTATSGGAGAGPADPHAASPLWRISCEVDPDPHGHRPRAGVRPGARLAGPRPPHGTRGSSKAPAPSGPFAPLQPLPGVPGRRPLVPAARPLHTGNPIDGATIRPAAAVAYGATAAARLMRPDRVRGATSPCGRHALGGVGHGRRDGAARGPAIRNTTGPAPRAATRAWPRYFEKSARGCRFRRFVGPPNAPETFW